MKYCPHCNSKKINSYEEHLDWCRNCKTYIPNYDNPYWEREDVNRWRDKPEWTYDRIMAREG